MRQGHPGGLQNHSLLLTRCFTHSDFPHAKGKALCRTHKAFEIQDNNFAWPWETLSHISHFPAVKAGRTLFDWKKTNLKPHQLIWYIAGCCGLGMVISNLVLPLKPCSLPPIWGTEGKDHGLRFGTIYWNSNEVRKQILTSTMLMKEGIRKEVIHIENTINNRQYQTAPSARFSRPERPPSSWPCPLPLAMKWGGTEQPLCPGHAPSTYCKKWTLSWPESGQEQTLPSLSQDVSSLISR